MFQIALWSRSLNWLSSVYVLQVWRLQLWGQCHWEDRDSGRYDPKCHSLPCPARFTAEHESWVQTGACSLSATQGRVAAGQCWLACLLSPFWASTNMQLLSAKNEASALAAAQTRDFCGLQYNIEMPLFRSSQLSLLCSTSLSAEASKATAKQKSATKAQYHRLQ